MTPEQTASPERPAPSRSGRDRNVNVMLGPMLDLDELWRVRSLVWGAEGVGRVRLSFAAVRSLAADALLLLHEELAGLERRGVPVSLDRVSPRTARQLRNHPIRRFLRDEEDELYTDPDLDHVGFRPSRH